MSKSASKTRLTKQRKLVLNIVKSACYHPTADQVYRLARKRLPSISVGTVYRNLDMLLEQNLIRKINIPSEPARFDAESKNRAYFVCREKGVIYDLKIDPKKVKKLFKDQSTVDSINDFNILLFGSSKVNADERGLRKGVLKH